MSLDRAVRIHRFGPPEVISVETVARPRPAEGEVLVRVKAAGVGPWDALIRSGKSAMPQPLPLTLGSDLSGVVGEVGGGVSELRPGDEVFGVTNPQFTGAYADYAVALAGRIARKPKRLDHIHAASVPVIAATAWQMLFDHARVLGSQTILVHGAAGNVGAYLVRLARHAGARIVATARAKDLDYVKELGANRVIDVSSSRFEDGLEPVDAVMDTVGGDVQTRSLAVLKPGGILVSAAAPPDQKEAERRGVRAKFFLVDVRTELLARLASMIQACELDAHVGTVLPLTEARAAHEMPEGQRPHPGGKIVLTTG
jgi:NADPH:quinone reductase-like Zn-dependent oxidoreductase